MESAKARDEHIELRKKRRRKPTPEIAEAAQQRVTAALDLLEGWKGVPLTAEERVAFCNYSLLHELGKDVTDE